MRRVLLLVVACSSIQSANAGPIKAVKSVFKHAHHYVQHFNDPRPPLTDSAMAYDTEWQVQQNRNYIEGAAMQRAVSGR